MVDIHRPFDEPARSLYSFIQRTSRARGTPTGERLLEGARALVHQEADRLARLRGLRAPTETEVLQAELVANGCSDYEARWAYGIARHMRPLSVSEATDRFDAQQAEIGGMPYGTYGGY